MKKFAFWFILIFGLLNGFHAFAAETLFSFPFEDEKEMRFWSGAYLDSSAPYIGDFSVFLNNPFGEEKNGKITHVLDYAETVHLESGKIYTLRGYVVNPLNSYSSAVRARASLISGARSVIVDISGIGDEWSEFSTTFYVGETGSYNLSLHFANGDTDYGFFVDELSLYEKDTAVSSVVLYGQEEILIPATGSLKAYYQPLLQTSDGLFADILISSSLYAQVTLPDGVTFNSSDFSLTVDSSAHSGNTVTISCTLRNEPYITPTSLSVKLTDNMIDDSSFDNENILWETSSNLEKFSEEGNSFIALPTNDYGDFGYFATLTYDKPLLLIENVLYVMHARVKADNDIAFPAIYAKNSSVLNADSNTVFFNITDISGGEWLDVFAAFVPEASGIYNIALNLCSTYDCTVFADDITLSSEVLSPSYVTLHAPGNIAVPDVKTDYNVSAFIRDRLGNILDEDVRIILEDTTSSVYFDSDKNIITVLPDAAPGKYYLYAYYPNNAEISARLPFTVSYDYIGDGTFENTVPNEWWMVSSPYDTDFFIRFNGSSKRALVNCDGSYFMLLNNSYVHLTENSAYVFNSSFSASEKCTVTLFIETLDSQILPLAQFPINSGTTLDDFVPPALFLAETDCVGRLFLYIESESGGRFSVYTDNLSLKKASVSVANLHVTGNLFVNGAAEAKFSFLNTIAQNNDTSSCAVNWYISDSPHGEYTLLESSEKNIYFDTSFLNKYVLFEVVPICPITGFAGNTARSMPFFIGYEDDYASGLSLPSFTPSSKSYFSDIDASPEKDYINLLAHNKIVIGKEAGKFYPDEPVTRAEFSKMLATAFHAEAYPDFKIFEDVNKGDYFYDSVYALCFAGICEGTSPSFFSPSAYLTHEEAALMLIRTFEKFNLVPKNVSFDFKDADNISPWAKEAAEKAGYLNIINYKNTDFFYPRAQTTRAEAAAFTVRLVNSLKAV